MPGIMDYSQMYKEKLRSAEKVAQMVLESTNCFTEISTHNAFVPTCK